MQRWIKGFSLMLLVLPITAQAESYTYAALQPRETAQALAPGAWQVGVFNPLRVGLRWFELEIHPLAALVAPHADIKVPIAGDGPEAWQWTAVLGLAVPTPATRMAKPFGFSGDLVPSCKVTAFDPAMAKWCQRPGWMAVPKLGLIGSRQFGHDGKDGFSALTLRAEVAKGIAFSGQAARPLDAWAPVDLQFAPYVGATRGQLRVSYDQLVTTWLRVRGELGGYYTSRADDDPLSIWTGSAYLGVDVATGAHTRLTLGAMVYNLDRHQRKVTTDAEGFAQVDYVRSHEVWPTVDFIWSY